MKHITRTVWILSLVSLFNDTASEMLYPIMPIYLKSIGFSVVIIGILEGVAELVAGLSKGYFGKRSDLAGKRVPFVRVGYALSAISKPIIAVFAVPIWVFFARTIDKIGKGVRNGARDALLSDEATPKTKGKVFGFHRSMDTIGAAIGPSLALVYLYYNPGDYRSLFYVTIIPGILTVIATFLVKEKNQIATPPKKIRVSFLASFAYLRNSPVQYKRLMVGLLIFAVVNSSDMFLILKAKSVGFSDTYVIGLYIFYNLVFALLAFPLGMLADKFSLKSILLIGLVVFTLVYVGLSFAESTITFGVLFFMYGIYAAATDGVSKAWISNMVSKTETATAIGTYVGFQSILAFVASSLTGVIWYFFGPPVAFGTIAVTTAAVAIYLLFMVPAKSPSTTP